MATPGQKPPERIFERHGGSGHWVAAVLLHALEAEQQFDDAALNARIAGERPPIEVELLHTVSRRWRIRIGAVFTGHTALCALHLLIGT